MTTTTSETSPRSSTEVSGQAIPLARLVGLEVRKMVDTRAGMWLLIIMAAIGFLVSGGLLIWGSQDEQTFATFLGFIATPLTMLLPIMGIMSATQEWSQRTGLATFTLVPRRGRIIAAKIGAAIVLTLVLLIAAFLAAALATAISGGDFSLIGISVTGLVLSAVIFTLQGVAFGSAFLNTPIAIVATLILPTMWSILTMMINPLRDVATWLDLTQVTLPLLEGAMTGENWAQLASASVLWVGLPLVIGSYRILTREVK